MGKCLSSESELFRDAHRFACLLEGSHGASAESRLDLAAREDLIESRRRLTSLAKCGKQGFRSLFLQCLSSSSRLGMANLAAVDNSVLGGLRIGQESIETVGGKTGGRFLAQRLL